MKKNAAKQPKTITNKRARFDYDLNDQLTAGIVLSGPEVKSLRQGHAILRGSFVMVKDGELWLNNMQVNPLKTNMQHLPEGERTRPRKLLVTARQLKELTDAKHQGSSIVPIKLLTESRHIKVVIGIGRGRKKYDKRQVIKQREQERAAKRGF